MSRTRARTVDDARGSRGERQLLPVVLALALLVLDAPPAAAQWPEVERRLDGSPPVTFGLDTSRFRVSALGTKPVIAIEDPSYGSLPYRFIDADLRGTAISLDLTLRWPTSASVGAGFGTVEPYFLFGPMLVDHSRARSEGAMSVGLSWGAGLSWRFARNAELFGGYRLMQYGRESSSHGERPLVETDLIGHDVLYGISVRF